MIEVIQRASVASSVGPSIYSDNDFSVDRTSWSEVWKRIILDLGSYNFTTPDVVATDIRAAEVGVES